MGTREQGRERIEAGEAAPSRDAARQIHLYPWPSWSFFNKRRANKALDLSPNLSGGVGSNPTGCKLIERPIGATVARQIPVLKVTCSNHVSVTAALSLGGPGGGLQFHSRFATERFDSVWAASFESEWSPVHIHAGRPRRVRAVLPM